MSSPGPRRAADASQTKRFATTRQRRVDLEPVRILTLITRWELGGAQQVALHTLAGLSPARYRSFVIAGQGGLLDAEARSLPGADVRLWRCFKHPIRPWWDVVTLFRLVHFMRKYKIQIVHTHSSKAGFLGRAAARISGVPHVLHTIHGWPFHAYQPASLRTFYIFLEKLAARWTQVLIAVSSATRAKGLAHHIGRPEQYEIIYPATELGAFRPGTMAQRRKLRSEFGFPLHSLVVGMVACLKPQKAPLDFIAAAARVKAAFPQAKFLLVGDGPLRKRVENEILRLGLQSDIKVTGWRQDVPRLLAGFDLLAHSARWEGLPCVFAQAAAAGLAVVANDVEGTSEIVIPNKTGLLVPAARPDLLAEGMLKLLRNPGLRQRLGRSARKSVGNFSVQNMQKSIIKMYVKVIK